LHLVELFANAVANSTGLEAKMIGSHPDEWH
jgi:hypothetical protein